MIDSSDDRLLQNILLDAARGSSFCRLRSIESASFLTIITRYAPRFLQGTAKILEKFSITFIHAF